MPPATSQQDLSQALETLQQSLYVLFMHYKGYIKAILLFVFIYLFYKLGNLSVKDQILGQKQELAELIDKRISIRVQIPKKIERMRKINKFVLFLTVVLLIGYASGFYFKYKPIIRNSGVILILLVGGVISVLTALNVYKFYLNRKFRQTDNLERVISKKLNEFTSVLGPKVNSILKHHLCKEKFQKLHSSMYSIQCQKPDCKQLRSLYKTRNQAVQSLVDEVINFQWCSICKKRAPFDEYLPFQYRQFQQKGQSQEQQVKNKMYYLVDGIQRMRKWLFQTSPCNCSKLYWHLSTNKIIEYKKTIKITEPRTKQLQRKNKY